MKTWFLLLLAMLMALAELFAQPSKSLLSRIQAVSNGTADFFNVDGIEVTSRIYGGEFSKQNLAKQFKHFGISEGDFTTSDSAIAYQNFYIFKKETLYEGIVQHNAYYFVAMPDWVKIITFAAINKTDQTIQREMVNLLVTNGIPFSKFQSYSTDSIDFAGRTLILGSNCYWLGINNVQCPYRGQMNWSVYASLQDAAAGVEIQSAITRLKKIGKLVSEAEVDIVFEGSPVKAKRLVYDIKGIKSLLLAVGGGKTLTIYYVAAPVRENFVGCVMSFWNNDVKNTEGLPPLLAEVMTLKRQHP
jgi:hypothetical protein